VERWRRALQARSAGSVWSNRIIRRTGFGPAERLLAVTVHE
jgi:hypothetical protein